MSQEDLVTAYTAGRISRRDLIRGLVAAGISTGAAVSYAHLLAPERALAGSRPWAEEFPDECGDEYPTIDMLVVDQQIEKVRQRGRLRVKARFVRAESEYGDESTQGMIEFIASAQGRTRKVIMGSETVTLIDGDTPRVIAIKLDDDSPLRGVKRKTVTITTRRLDSDRYCFNNVVKIKGALK